MPTRLPKPSRNWALFLDVDGTLLDIAATPQAAEVPAGLTAVLAALDRSLGHALALVSGRALADLDRLFAPLRLAAAGQHGAELRLSAEGCVSRAAPDARLPAISAALHGFAESRPGILIEDKGLSLAIHFRNALAEKAAVYRAARDAIAEDDEALTLLPARKAIEIKARSVSKARAVERFMAVPPFAGRRPVFIGDDVTDEDGFAAAERLAGEAIRVGLGGESRVRARIASASALRRWLKAAAEALAEA